VPSIAAAAPPLPESAADLTAAWFTAAFQSAGRDITVVAATTPAPVGTGQMASCYRVGLDYGGADRGPSSVVVKLPAPNAGGHAAMGYTAEVRFYELVASSVAVRTAGCHYLAIDDSGLRFVLVLDDLAPAEQGDQIRGCTIAEARLALANLAGLHGPRWNDPTLAEFTPLDRDASSGEMLAQFLGMGTEAFVENLGDLLTAEDAATLRAFVPLVGAWAAGRRSPYSVVHGDFRCDNLLFAPEVEGAPNEDCQVVDWQTATVGLPGRDVGFFLATSLPIALRREHERSLVAEYHAHLVAHGVAGYAFEQCWDDYRYGVGHAVVVTVLGAYVGQRTERGDRMFAAMAERTCAALRDLETLGMC
jgi:hypothetical protein